jgi:hypothetical protein
MNRVEAAKTPEDQVDEELLAYAIEEAIQRGVSPDGVTNGRAAHNWLQIIFKAFKRVLKQFGIDSDSLTVGDLVNLAHGAAQLELKGTWHGTRAEFDAFDFKYMGSGEGAQAFSWGNYTADIPRVAQRYQEIGARKGLFAWGRLPEIEKWEESQQPKFGGFTRSDFYDLSYEKGKSIAGVPSKFAPVMEAALKKYAKYQSEDNLVFTSPAKEIKDLLEKEAAVQLDSLYPRRVFAKPIVRFTAAMARQTAAAVRAGQPVPKREATPVENLNEMVRKNAFRAEQKAWLDSLDYSQFKAVSAEPLYKGFSTFQIETETYDPVAETAKDILFDAYYVKNTGTREQRQAAFILGEPLAQRI